MLFRSRLLKEKATIIVIGNKFTRSIYHAKVLCSIFGNYYLPVDEEETVVQQDSIKLTGLLPNGDTAQIPNAKKDLKNKKTESKEN